MSLSRLSRAHFGPPLTTRWLSKSSSAALSTWLRPPPGSTESLPSRSFQARRPDPGSLPSLSVGGSGLSELCSDEVHPPVCSRQAPVMDCVLHVESQTTSGFWQPIRHVLCVRLRPRSQAGRLALLQNYSHSPGSWISF